MVLYTTFPLRVKWDAVYQEDPLIALDEAYAALKTAVENVEPKGVACELASEDSLNRFLARAVHGTMDHPAFNGSAMDGYAISFAPTRKSFKCIGTVAAGDPPDGLLPGPGECVKIMTGAPIPSSTDTVIMVEHSHSEGDRIRFTQEYRQGQHVRFAGENVSKGDLLYDRGTAIKPGVLAGILSQGLRFVEVLPKVRIGIGATGNEIVDYRRPLGEGQIYNSNALAVAGLLQSESACIYQLGVFSDRLQETCDALAANSDLDLLILTGGVSMGSFDMVPAAAEAAGYRRIFHKIRMKPGKPLWFGKHPSGTLLFGLPGNPVSALVGTMLFIAPVVKALASGSFSPPAWCLPSWPQRPWPIKGVFPCFVP